MKFNLKNRPQLVFRSILPPGEPHEIDSPFKEWFEGFEKELREDKDWYERYLAEVPSDEYCIRKLKWIKELLGE